MGFLEKFGLFNKRKDQRIELPTPIKCFCAYRLRSGENGEYAALITNFSEGGLLLGVNKGKIPAGAEAEVRFQLPRHLEGVSVHGTVIRSYPERPQVWSYVAIQFANKEEAGVRLLLSFILGKL